ncbi:MAG: penicillin acylase family protein, partial [Candidatus Hydrogenedentes bacterium]|nr:penicillin acylase family protein [Candidatus Hydrogenedentota bacterium]
MDLYTPSRIILALGLVLATTLCSAQAPSADDPEALWDRATLYRDEWGVPHIYAEDPRAMAFALGYAQAEDHLEELLLAYRYANGRAAEVLGEGMAASDTFAIQMQHAELARDAFEVIDDLTRDLCEGLALGINTWLIEHADVAPPWAEGV